MKEMSYGTARGKKRLRVFDEELAELHMRGQWLSDELLRKAIGGPRPKGEAYLWKWETVYQKLLEACEVMPESFTARRNLGFVNPGLPLAATHTISMGCK